VRAFYDEVNNVNNVNNVNKQEAIVTAATR